MDLLKNQVISWQGRTWRVICLYRGKIALFDMSSNKAALDIHDLEEMERKVRSGEIQTVADEFSGVQLVSCDTASSSGKRAQSTYELLEPVINDPECLFNDSLRRRRIREVCGEDVQKKSMFRRWLPVYWRKGQCFNALLPQSGRHLDGKQRNTTRKLGRKNRKGVEYELPLSNELRALFNKYIEKHLLVPSALSVRQTYNHMMIEFENDRSKYTQSELAKPTYYQFSCYYYRYYPVSERNRRRYQTKDYEKNVRPLHSSTNSLSYEIGSAYEIDSTLDDVYLVSDDEEPKFLGRPTLYIVSDVATGMITGFKISLDDPQYKVMAEALKMAISDKVEYCRKLDIEISPEDWPASGIPASIVADNAEVLGKQIEPFCRIHHVNICNTASYRADAKGTVERAIGMLQHGLKGLIHAAPDKVTQKKAGGVDTRGKASLTIREYETLVARTVLSVNRRWKENGPRNVPSDVASTPNELWGYYTRTGQIQLRYCHNKELQDITLMPNYEVSLSRDGARAKNLGISYHCPQLLKDGYMDRRNRNKQGAESMRIFVDRSNVERAWLFPNIEKDPQYYWPCQLAPKSDALNGMCMIEAVEYLEKQKEKRADSRDDQDEFTRKMLKENIKLTQEAEARTKKHRAAIKESIKDVTKTRHDERIKEEKRGGQASGSQASGGQASGSQASGGQTGSSQASGGQTSDSQTSGSQTSGKNDTSPSNGYNDSTPKGRDPKDCSYPDFDEMYY